MVFKLVQTDEEFSFKIKLEPGTHIFGRGKFLNVNDKRISRQHGQLEVTDDTLIVTALHQNPCFYKKSGNMQSQMLRQNNSVSLNNGDKLGLLPTSYWFEVVHYVLTDDDQNKTSHKENQENQVDSGEETDVEGDSKYKTITNATTVSENDNLDSQSTEISSPCELLNVQESNNMVENCINQNSSGIEKQCVDSRPSTVFDTNKTNTDEPGSSSFLSENLEKKKPNEDGLSKDQISTGEKRPHNLGEDNQGDEVKKIKTEPENKPDIKLDPDVQQAGSSNSNDNNRGNPPGAPPAAPPAAPAAALRERCMYGASCYSRRINRVSAQQLEILWQFLYANKDIATAFNRSLQAKEFSKKKWTELAQILNTQVDGTYKDWKGWSKYWVDYKAKLKARVAAVRSSYVRTGGAPSTDKNLTEVDFKFLKILGEDFVEGLPGVRVEPVSEPQEIISTSVVMDVQNYPVSGSVFQNIQSVLNLPTQLSTPCLSTAPSTTETLSPAPCLTPSPNRTPIRSNHSVTPTTRSPRRRRQRRDLPMAPEFARRELVRSSQMRAEAAVRTADAMEKIAENMTQLQNTAMNIERRNPVHRAQFSHPLDADWGAGEKAPCPWGAACAKRDPRHWRDHEHPPGKEQPPPGAGARVVHRQGNVFYINAHTVRFYDDHMEAEDSDGNSVDYDYEF